MKNPEFGRPNYGGMAGAVVGSIGGLFAILLVPAIIYGKPDLVIRFHAYNLAGWAVSLPIGWFLGWMIGRPLGNKFKSERAEMAGGVLGGLLTIVLVAMYGLYLVTRHA